jgi:hypothetical protein
MCKKSLTLENVIILHKDEMSVDPYGYYDQYGNRYFFNGQREVELFLKKTLLTFLLRGRSM